MPIPAGVARVVMSGEMRNGEIWSSGFWLSFITIEDQAAATAAAEGIYLQLKKPSGECAVFSMMNYLWYSSTNLDTVTVYVYNTGGITADLIGVSGGHNDRGAATNQLPNQVASVLSLRTGIPGRRNRGRMYMPATGAPIQAGDGQLASVAMPYILSGWQVSFDGIVGAGLGVPVVVSTVGTTATVITSLVLDSKFDIQRRRANNETAVRVLTGPIPA